MKLCFPFKCHPLHYNETLLLNLTKQIQHLARYSNWHASWLNPLEFFSTLLDTKSNAFWAQKLKLTNLLLCTRNFGSEHCFSKGERKFRRIALRGDKREGERDLQKESVSQSIHSPTAGFLKWRPSITISGGKSSSNSSQKLKFSLRPQILAYSSFGSTGFRFNYELINTVSEFCFYFSFFFL